MRRRPQRWLAGLALALSGCGWSAGLAAPDEGSTIGIEVFDVDRDVLERGLAPLFHSQLTRAASDLVDAPLVAPDSADYVVRGKIIEYRRRGGIRSEDFELLETAIRIRVEAWLVDRRTGETVGERVQNHVWSGYGLDAATNEDTARERAIHYLAETIVLDLFGPADATPPAPPPGVADGARTPPGTPANGDDVEP